MNPYYYKMISNLTPKGVKFNTEYKIIDGLLTEVNSSDGWAIYFYIDHIEITGKFICNIYYNDVIYVDAYCCRWKEDLTRSLNPLLTNFVRHYLDIINSTIDNINSTITIEQCTIMLDTIIKTLDEIIPYIINCIANYKIKIDIPKRAI